MAKTRTESTPRLVPPLTDPSGSDCEARELLRDWIDHHVHGNVARAARVLDCSWAFLDRLLEGRTRPGVDFVFRCEATCGVPVDAWRVRQLQRAVGAS